MGCEVWMKLVEYSQTLPQRDGAAAAQPSDERALIDPFLGDLATHLYSYRQRHGSSVNSCGAEPVSSPR